MAIAGKVGAVYVSDVGAALVPFVDEATTADVTLKRYQVTDPNYRYWDLDTPVAVEVDGVPVAAGFSLERAGGFVVFEAAQDAEAVVTVSGSALTLVQAAGFFNWSVDLDGDDLDATTFASSGRKEFLRGLTGWSGSAEAHWGDERFFDSLGKIVVLKLFVDAGVSQSCLEGFALITGDGIEAPVDGLVEESVDFAGVGALYSRF